MEQCPRRLHIILTALLMLLHYAREQKQAGYHACMRSKRGHGGCLARQGAVTAAQSPGAACRVRPSACLRRACARDAWGFCWRKGRGALRSSRAHRCSPVAPADKQASPYMYCAACMRGVQACIGFCCMDACMHACMQTGPCSRVRLRACGPGWNPTAASGLVRTVRRVPARAWAHARTP